MWDWFKTVLYKSMAPALAMFAAIANPVVAIVMIIWQIIDTVVELTGDLKQKHGSLYSAYNNFMQEVGGSVFGQFPPAIASPLGFINSFVPLTEMLILVALASVFYMLALAVRVIKAWIPTVA